MWLCYVCVHDRPIDLSSIPLNSAPLELKPIFRSSSIHLKRYMWKRKHWFLFLTSISIAQTQNKKIEKFFFYMHFGYVLEFTSLLQIRIFPLDLFHDFNKKNFFFRSFVRLFVWMLLKVRLYFYVIYGIK